MDFYSNIIMHKVLLKNTKFYFSTKVYHNPMRKQSTQLYLPDYEPPFINFK